ncbi:signaling mucin HKR1-like isoform X2 [Trichoplusia ni]|uniref:Signaling mucin HKR1-like isoform X2 n=1 Tax=Trichoplusia ni TaxID=7111 RepID=A0A7E5WG69_TRINI|nr:signaling mucin HKR1-like isoform X2 [Trichoplusia ni]
MKSIIIIATALQIAIAYHDPDLNYHLSQVQKVSNCDKGYSYAAPAVQLTTTGVKAPAPANTYLPVSQPIVVAPAIQYSGSSGYSSGGSAGYSASASSGYSSSGSSGYSAGGGGGYSTGITYQSVAPQITYATQPASSYQSSSSLASNYATAQEYSTKEVHGYATSAGLSSAATNSKTVTPLATYAQAPIISKVTAAPLIAKFSLAPAKTSYITQNLVAQQAYSTGSLAKASLNSYSNVHSGGPVVSQVYAAPSSGYATSPALRVQQAQVAQYSAVAAPAVAQYSHVSVAAPAAVSYAAPSVSQYANSVSHGTASSSNYFTPVVSQHSGSVNSGQYSGAVVTQHAAPVVQQYSAPVVAQYSAPTVVQHSAPAPSVAHYSAPAVTHYSAPAVGQYSAPAAAHYSAPAVASVSHYASAPVVSHVTSSAYSAPAAAPAVTKVAAGPLVKNVHTEFLENYDAHPRYAFEYSVNDPHTGDIKQQKEERDGEVVKGQYSLVEPDGSVRTVNYVADWETGFHADVRNSKDNQH